MSAKPDGINTHRSAMVRRSRWPTRISFILVIVMGMLGFLYAVATWLPALGAIDLAGFAEGIDWVEALAAIGEQALQLLLGATSGGG
jgi:hypothetical protein